MKMSKSMLMTALICGSLCVGASGAYAEEKVQEFTLDEYVVTAARTETKLVDTPANITVVGAAEIESRHYQDVSEVLKDVPGAVVMDSGTGAQEKVIKLNGDERVLVLVDGRRVGTDMGLTNTARSSTDMNQLPDVSLIERIEVLKGAGGALYGSDAVGGVINIITKKADRSYGKVSVGTGSFGKKDMSAMYSFKEGKTGVTVSASKEEQDYYKYVDKATDSTKRWPQESDFENNKVSIKVSQELNDTNNLTVGYDYSKFEGHSTSSLGGSFAYLEKQTDNIHAKYDWTLNEKDDGYFQFYHNELDYKTVGASWQSAMKEKTNGIDIQQGFTLSDTNKLVVGASWRKADVDSTAGYNESIDNLAFYVSDNWEFVPTWTLSMGARWDDHSEAGSETTLSAGLNKKLDENSHVYINWSEVFKAPNTDDLYWYESYGYLTPTGKPAGMFGNTNLKPETGDTWTIGYQTKINDKTDIGISYFQSDLKDAIKWVGYDYDASMYSGWGGYHGYKVENVDEQKKRGMELTLNHELNDNVSLNASYTYLQVKEKTQDTNGFDKDANVVPNIYRLGVNYQDGKWDSNLWLRAGSGASSEEYLNSNYITLDCAVTYKASKDLKIFAKGYNLFNEAYAEQGGHNGSSYNYPAQSRRFLIGAEYSF